MGRNMSFDENPADDCYQLDQCIAEIKRLQECLADAEGRAARTERERILAILREQREKLEGKKADWIALNEPGAAHHCGLRIDQIDAIAEAIAVVPDREN